jgi:hypothetical protein
VSWKPGEDLAVFERGFAALDRRQAAKKHRVKEDSQTSVIKLAAEAAAWEAKAPIADKGLRHKAPE